MGQRERTRAVYLDLLVVAGLGLAAGLAALPGLLDIQSGVLEMVRIVVVAPFLLVAPGYAFVAAVFPREEDLSLLERSVFSLGASLALVALVGIGLDRLPVGVTVSTVLASQIGVVWGLVIFATVRRRRVGFESVGYLDLARRAWAGRDAVGGGSRLLQSALVVAALLTVGATAYAATQPLPSERYSELYLLGPDGSVEGVPEAVSPGESVDVTVGVYAHEYRTVSAGLQAQVMLPNGDREVVWTGSSELSHNETEERSVSLRLPQVQRGDRVKVEVLLFRESAPGSAVEPGEAYRNVHTWVTIGERAAGGSNQTETNR